VKKEKRACWICEEMNDCTCPDCFELQQTISKKLSRDWDEQEALTQSDIEKQQELRL